MDRTPTQTRPAGPRHAGAQHAGARRQGETNGSADGRSDDDANGPPNGSPNDSRGGSAGEFEARPYAPPAYGGSIADAVEVAPEAWPAGPAFAAGESGPRRPSAGPSVFTARPRAGRRDGDRPNDNRRPDGPDGPAPSRSRNGKTPDTWDIREAFLNLAAGRLTDTARNDAARANAFLSQYGFEPGDVRSLGFGLYPDPAEVEEYLRRCGFAADAVRDSRLTRDARGDLRGQWAGHLVLPIDDETGRCVDLAVVDPAPGPHRVMRVGLVRGAEASGVVAYGLRNALQYSPGKGRTGGRRGTLVLTEDLLEACLLNARGFGPVAAIGGEGGTFAPRRWEELSRLGIGTVTLAFREDGGRHDAVRDCLVHALRARTAPEVYVLEPTGPADCETLAETVRVHGVAAAEARLTRRSLAFHGKDFGAAPRTSGSADWATRPVEPAPGPEPQPRFARPGPTPRAWESLREQARAEMLRLPAGSAARRAAAALFAEVDAALAAGDFELAKDLLARGVRSPRGVRRAADRFEPAPRFDTRADGPPSRDDNDTDDHAGRSWFTAPGRVDGYARGWNYDGLSDEEGTRRAVTHTLAGVLEGLSSQARGPVIADRLHAERAGAIRPGTLTALTAADPAAGLAMLCDRVADALDRRAAGAVTVLLRDCSPGAFAALLVTHLTARINGGAGLTAGEVDARLAGRDAAHRYAAKPWLADEAADRLRGHGDRLKLVDARRADFSQTLIDLERCGALRAAGPGADGNGAGGDGDDRGGDPAGGVLCESADAGDLSRLAEFAARTGCWALAATAPNAPVAHAAPTWTAAPGPRDWADPDAADGDDGDEAAPADARLDRFRSLVGAWIDRADG